VSEKKQYTIQGPYSKETVTYCPDTKVVRLVSRADKDYYIELHDHSTSASGYKITWQNATGCGVQYIPEAVFYDLPALMTILNQARGHTIFEPVDIYAELPIATLFNEPKGGN
jgi:hypothetical protein